MAASSPAAVVVPTYSGATARDSTLSPSCLGGCAYRQFKFCAAFNSRMGLNPYSWRNSRRNGPPSLAAGLMP